MDQEKKQNNYTIGIYNDSVDLPQKEKFMFQIFS